MLVVFLCVFCLCLRIVSFVVWFFDGFGMMCCICFGSVWCSGMSSGLGLEAALRFTVFGVDGFGLSAFMF